MLIFETLICVYRLFKEEEITATCFNYIIFSLLIIIIKLSRLDLKKKRKEKKRNST